MLLHGELHPEDRSERHSLARAVRYLERLDPEAAVQVRDLVTHASLSLKTAVVRLESTLDAAPESDDVFSDEGTEAAEECEAPAAAPSGLLLTPASSPLPTTGEAATQRTNQSAARRTVGRDLRRELRVEKTRFFEAAKEHGLKTGGRQEKAMLAALSEFLNVPVESRRTPSSHQWSQAASAIETEDLRW